MAVITTSNGVITIALSNLLGTSGQPASITDAGQLLSDFDFTLTNGPGTVSTTHAGTGSTIMVGSGGAVSGMLTGQSLGWGVGVSGSTITLDGLGGLNTPKDLLLGVACTSGAYCNGNGSIASNPGHNPFALNGAIFTISATGITTDTTVSNAVFSFGTAGGDNVPGIPNNTVPEPASYLLLGTGLLGLGLLARRHVFA